MVQRDKNWELWKLKTPNIRWKKDEFLSHLHFMFFLLFIPLLFHIFSEVRFLSEVFTIPLHSTLKTCYLFLQLSSSLLSPYKLSLIVAAHVTWCCSLLYSHTAQGMAMAYWWPDTSRILFAYYIWTWDSETLHFALFNLSLKTKVHKFPAHFLHSISSFAYLTILLLYISYSGYTLSNKTQLADREW